MLLYRPVTIAGPKVRAGFIDAPVMGLWAKLKKILSFSFENFDYG